MSGQAHTRNALPLVVPELRGQLQPAALPATGWQAQVVVRRQDSRCDYADSLEAPAKLRWLGAGGSALQTTLNTLAVVFLLEIDDLLYNAVIDARYKRYARRHRFRLRWFDYYLLARGSAL